MSVNGSKTQWSAIEEKVISSKLIKWKEFLGKYNHEDNLCKMSVYVHRIRTI